MIRMARQTQALIPELENETGASLDFHRVGNLRVAFSPEREADLTRLESALAAEGVIAAHHIAGLSMYTPDGKFLIGAFDGLPGFLIATGCCGSGVGAHRPTKSPI